MTNKVAKKSATGTAKMPSSSSVGGDWRREMLERVRAIILNADPDMFEEAKWQKAANPLGVPTWSHAGIVCTGETYKDKIKLTFTRGAVLNDPAGLFNASLDGVTRRAIDLRRGDRIDERALIALIREAVAMNAAKATRGRRD